jgi:hypothetical protein
MKVTIEKVERLMERADVEYEVAKKALEAADGNLLDAIIALERDGKFGPNAGQGKSAAYSTAGSAANVVGESYGAMLPQTRVEPNFTLGNDASAKAGKSSKKSKADKAGKTGKADKAGPQDNYQQNYYQQGNYSQGNYQQSNYANGNYNSGPYKYRDESTAFEDSARRFGRWLGRVFRAGLNNYFEIWRGEKRVMYFPVILFLLCLIHWVFWAALVLIVIGLFCGCSYRFSGPNLGKKSVNDAMNEASEMAEEIKRGDDPHN